MTASFRPHAESHRLAAARAAARAAASAAAAAAAVADPAPHHALHAQHDRLHIVTALHDAARDAHPKAPAMDDAIVGVGHDPDDVVPAAPDADAAPPDVDRGKPDGSDPDAVHAAVADGVVANGDAEPDGVALDVVVAPHDPPVDDRRDPAEERADVDPVQEIPGAVPPDHHSAPLPEPQALDAHIDTVTLTGDAAPDPDSHSHMPELLPAPTTAPLPPPPHPPPPVQQPVKKKRKTYSTEEERRNARILKNRRTAEESRQRRMKRMKELEEYAAQASARERELQDEIRSVRDQMQEVTESLRQIVDEKNAEIAKRDAEICRLQEKLALK